MEKGCIGVGVNQIGMLQKVILKEILPRNISFMLTQKEILFMNITPKINILIATILRLSHFFQKVSLQDIFCVDYPKNNLRFQLNYVYVNLSSNKRYLLRFCLHKEGRVPSIVNIFPSAGWLERETWGYVWSIF